MNIEIKWPDDVRPPLPLLHPDEHAWIETMCGRKLTNEEAQDALREAILESAMNYWINYKNGYPQ